MSRIRSIKPEWLDDEELSIASSDARVLSVALITLADDYGNGRAGRVWLAGRVFPGKPIEVLDAAFAELEQIRYTRLYDVAGQRYFSIRTWDTHQRVDKPGLPKVPGPENASPRQDSDNSALRNIRETPANIPETPGKFPSTRASYSDPGSDPSYQALPDQPEKSRSARPRVAPDVPREMTETWLPDQEQVAALATKYGVDPRRIDVEVPEFRWYWRKGRGSGQRKTGRGWAQTFGNRIGQLAKSELLYASRPGAPAAREASGETEAQRRAREQLEAERAEKRRLDGAEAERRGLVPVGDTKTLLRGIG